MFLEWSTLLILLAATAVISVILWIYWSKTSNDSKTKSEMEKASNSALKIEEDHRLSAFGQKQQWKEAKIRAAAESYRLPNRPSHSSKKEAPENIDDMESERNSSTEAEGKRNSILPLSNDVGDLVENMAEYEILPMWMAKLIKTTATLFLPATENGCKESTYSVANKNLSSSLSEPLRRQGIRSTSIDQLSQNKESISQRVSKEVKKRKFECTGAERFLGCDWKEEKKWVEKTGNRIVCELIRNYGGNVRFITNNAISPCGRIDLLYDDGKNRFAIHWNPAHHYVFPNTFHSTVEEFDECVATDEEKMEISHKLEHFVLIFLPTCLEHLFPADQEPYGWKLDFAKQNSFSLTLEEEELSEEESENCERKGILKSLITNALTYHFSNPN